MIVKQSPYKFEFYKLLRNKPLVITVISILLGLFIVSTAFLIWYNSMLNPRDYFERTYITNINTLPEWEQELEQLNSVPDDERTAEWHESVYKSKYAILHAKLYIDYFESGKYIVQRLNGPERFGNSYFYSMSIVFFYPLMLFSIVITAFVTAGQYSGGHMRNVLASPVSRQKVFRSQLLVILTILSAVFLIIFLPAVILGLRELDTYYLMLDLDGLPVAVNWFGQNVSRLLGTYVLMLLSSAVTYLTAAGTKKVLPSLLAYPFMLAVCTVVYKYYANAKYYFMYSLQVLDDVEFLYIGRRIFTRMYGHFIPLEFFNNNLHGMTGQFFLVLFAHIAATGIILLIARRIFLRRSF